MPSAWADFKTGPVFGWKKWRSWPSCCLFFGAHIIEVDSIFWLTLKDTILIMKIHEEYRFWFWCRKRSANTNGGIDLRIVHFVLNAYMCLRATLRRHCKLTGNSSNIFQQHFLVPQVLGVWWLPLPKPCRCICLKLDITAFSPSFCVATCTPKSLWSLFWYKSHANAKVLGSSGVYHLEPLTDVQTNGNDHHWAVPSSYALTFLDLGNAHARSVGEVSRCEAQRFL